MTKTYRRTKRRHTFRISDAAYEVAKKKKRQTGRPMFHFVDQAVKKTFPLEYKQALQRVQEQREKMAVTPEEEADLEQ